MKIILKHRHIYILILTTIIITILVELPTWHNKCYFISGGDIKTQWYPFYVSNRRIMIDSIKAGQFPFYSWILFLGNNIWSSMLSYGYVDIFNLLFYPFNINYFLIFDIQFVIKLLVGGIGAFLLIDYLMKNKKVAFISGLLFSFSSYALYFSSQSGFLSFMVLVPYYILGIVQFVKEQKKLLFVITTSLLFITNYYLFFSVTVLSPFIFAYAYININKNFKGLFMCLLSIIGLYIVGFLITCVFTVPAFVFLLQNERLGNFNEHLLYYGNIKTYLHIINSFFVPNQLFIYGNNVFNFNEHTLKELCTYSSAIVVLLLPQIINSKNKIFKVSTILMYVLFGLIFFTPIIGSFLNGFSEVCFRWTIVYILFNIFVFDYIFFIENNISKRLLWISFTVVSLLILITYFLGLNILNEEISNYRVQLLLSLSVVVFLFIYALFINNKRIIMIIVLIEIVFYSVLFGIKSLPTGVDVDDIERINTVLSDKNSDSVKDYLNTLEEENYYEFYRTYVDYDSLYWDFSRNMNLLYGFEGVMSYDSTYEPSFSDMIDINEKGIIKDIYWEYSIEDPYLLNFVSCKYGLTLSEDAIPFNNYEIVDNNYRGGILVSKNLDYEPIGVTYNKRISDANSDFDNLNKYIVSDDESIDKYLLSSQKNIIKNVTYYNNQFEGDIYSDEQSFVVLKVSYDDGFSVCVNGEKVPIYKCNGGMMGFPISKGDNHVNMVFVPKGFKLGCVLSLIGGLLFIFIIFNKNHFIKKTA